MKSKLMIMIVFMIGITAYCSGIKNSATNSKINNDILLMKGWRSVAKHETKVETLYRDKGGKTFDSLPEAVNVSGVDYWISAEKKIAKPVIIPKDRPVYLLIRLYATGSTNYYSITAKSKKEKFFVRVPCYTGSWQTIIVKINDMARYSQDPPTSYPGGKKIDAFVISQRCLLGDEKEGENGNVISSKHAFIIGEIKLFQTPEEVKYAKLLAKKLLPNLFYRGKLVQNIKVNGDIKVWTAPSAIRVFRDSPQPEITTNKIKISAPRDGWESFQVVTNSKTGSEVASLSISNLKNLRNNKIIPSSEIDIFPVEYVRIVIGPDALPVNRWYPDPLSRNKSVKLKAGQNQPFWVSCHVPRNTPAGIYQGTIKLNVGKTVTKIPFELKVWDFTLPLSPHFQSNLQIWDKPKTKEFWQMQQMLGRYKLYDGNRWAGVPGNHQKIMVEKYGQNTVKLTPAFGHGTRKPMKFRGKKFGTPEYAETLTKFIKQQCSLLKKINLEEKAYAYIWDEPQGNFGVIKNIVKICKIIKKANPKLKTLAASGAFPALIGHVDIFAANYNQNVLTKCDKVDKSLPYSFWRGADLPVIPKDPLFIRLWGFENWKYNFTGYFAWGISVWKHRFLPNWYAPWEHVGKPMGKMGTLNGFGLLIYPGNVPQSKPDIPCYSIRLEMIRDMVGDYECLYMLNEIAKQSSDSEVKKEITNLTNECLNMIKGYNKYENNPEKYYRLKNKVAETIVKHQEH